VQSEISAFFHSIPAKGVDSGRLTTPNCVTTSQVYFWLKVGKEIQRRYYHLNAARIDVVKNQLQ